ncbi:hypothetical protein LWI29_013946 [Acer saccharum]|uniref:Uncharacterized protein n=1 Tax=Acer saccharum TaxID=4024 RepID=A0AA39W3A2_ACESA|nr:hypothetical protein LWI29_013946 [Acer saccharum]
MTSNIYEPQGKLSNALMSFTKDNTQPGMDVRVSSIPKNWDTINRYPIFNASSVATSSMSRLKVASNSSIVGLSSAKYRVKIDSSLTSSVSQNPSSNVPMLRPLHKQNSSLPNRASFCPKPNHISSLFLFAASLTDPYAKRPKQGKKNQTQLETRQQNKLKEEQQKQNKQL